MNQWFAIRSLTWLAGAALLLVPLVPAAAQAGTDAPATAPAMTLRMPAAASQDEGPSEAAWAVLQALRDYVHAAQILDDPQKRERDLARAQREFMDLVVAPPDMDKEVRLRDYVLLWPAVVAHYVDGFERNHMSVLRAESQTLVTAVAIDPKDQAAYDQVFREITKELQEQGYSGQDLAARRQTLLIRKLARQGVGYPVAATVILTMQTVKDQWKVAKLDLRPPFVPAAGSQPSGRGSTQTVLPGKIRLQMKMPATQPATNQPGGAGTQ